MTNLDIKLKVGLRIKELRSECGISQEAFANQIGMSRTYFAEVETGKRNVSMLNFEKIVNGLGISMADFFQADFFRNDAG